MCSECRHALDRPVSRCSPHRMPPPPPPHSVRAAALARPCPHIAAARCLPHAALRPAPLPFTHPRGTPLPRPCPVNRPHVSHHYLLGWAGGSALCPLGRASMSVVWWRLMFPLWGRTMWQGQAPPCSRNCPPGPILSATSWARPRVWEWGLAMGMRPIAWAGEQGPQPGE